MSRPERRRIIDAVTVGVIVLAMVAPSLLTVPFWLAGAFLGGCALVIVTTATAGPYDSSSDDHSEA